MSELTDREHLLTKQYRDASNLNARIQLHAGFSTNQYGWCLWLFDQLDLPRECRILELGCGPGGLWLENLARLPEGWDIVMTDFSAGMVQQARRNLQDHRPFEFAIVDAQAISFPSERFDAVIANHMLYHVPGVAKALSEMRRVLKPGGRFYASTIGDAHMEELWALVDRFEPDLAEPADLSFTLESGTAQLSPWFSKVALRRFEDALEVTEVAPLVAYVLSHVNMTKAQRSGFAKMVEQEMSSQGGAIRIIKDPGVLEGSRSGSPLGGETPSAPASGRSISSL